MKTAIVSASTAPLYPAIVFEPASDPLLFARRKVIKGRDQRYFYIPPDIVGVEFGDMPGHVDVWALIPGTVHLSAFVYLEACMRSRSLSTMRFTSRGS
jgi:hypothetical protein